MKRWMKSAGIALAALLVLAAGYRAIVSREANKAALQAQQEARKVVQTLQLTDNEVVTAATAQLTQTLPLAGPLKARNFAVVKARVAGELQELTVREGDFVKAGQTIAKVDATEYQARLRQAQQAAESARAQVDIARRSFDNNRSLVEQGFISKTALDSSASALASAEANFRAAVAGADVAAKALNDTVLRSPIAGQVAQRFAQPGERVPVDFRIVEVVDVSQLELEASISAADSLDVRIGQTALLKVEGSRAEITAKVTRINPSTAAGSRAVLVYLTLEQASGLRQGLFAQGSLTTGTVSQRALPLQAIRTDKPQPYVQWIRDGRITHQAVVLGMRGEDRGQTVVAVDGVEEGAQVLAGSVGVIPEGTRVERMLVKN